MRRMNYNPFKKPFASGELSETNGLHFTLDNPLEEGIYLFEIVENDLNSQNEKYVQIGILKYYNTDSTSSEFYGQADNYVISYIGNKESNVDIRKNLIVSLLNGYTVDLATMSSTIQLYKII